MFFLFVAAEMRIASQRSFLKFQKFARLSHESICTLYWAGLPRILENVRTQGCPSETDWWKDSSKKSAETDGRGSKGGEENGETCSVAGAEFHNCGFETWEAARKQWRAAKVKEKRPHPPPVRYDEVVRGLTQVVRTYELPDRMTLPDIIEVFVDIWECEKDY
uniref:DUF4050 domain-containing protein n=1 Tax=Ditylum brightwellii TaxID=49249 RepID=A0A7S4SXZ0_9STRA